MTISKSNAVQATTAEPLVAKADYVELSRLVIEHAWRADHGRADTIHELYVDDGVLDVGMPLRDARRSVNGVGSSLRLPRGGPFATCAETFASWPTAPTQPKARPS